MAKTAKVTCLPAASLIFVATFVSAETGTERATFTKDIAPIFQQKCESCHRPSSIAPMSLMSYQETRPWAASIREAVANREMPPWHIDKTVGIQEFKNDRSLSDEQIATIVTWIDDGAPRGKAEDMPPPGSGLVSI